MIRSRSLIAALATAIAWFGAEELQAQVKGVRTFVAGRWIETARIADTSGLILRRPELIAATDERLYVLDYTGMVLRAFDFRGRTLWTVGKPGAKKGEFQGPVDLKSTPDGGVVVLDAQNRNLTWVDSLGTVRAVTPLSVNYSAIGLVQHAGFVGVPFAAALAVAVDKKGGIHGRAENPSELVAIPELAREALIADADSAAFVVTFRWSTRMYLVSRDLKEVRAFEQIERTAFPGVMTTQREGYSIRRIEPTAREVVRGVALTRAQIIIVRSVRGDQLPVIDLYDRETGKYEGSRHLPARAGRVVARGDQLIAVVSSPAPVIYAWKWVPQRSTSSR